MGNMILSPTLLVFAGPNGSGKSTITRNFPICGEYVNADNIKKTLRCDDMQAAVIAEKTRETLLKSGTDFTFETVLSTTRNLDLMKKAKAAGYYIICLYVLTNHPSVNVSRVKTRVQNGGHNVPEDKIHARYYRCMQLCVCQ